MNTKQHTTPPVHVVLMEQFYSIALGLKWAATAGAALVILVTGFVVFDSDFGRMSFEPSSQMLPAIVAFILPAALWRDEVRNAKSYFWTMPVERRQHAILRITAGWMWLMVAITAFVAWQLLVSAVTGGPILAQRTVDVVNVSTFPSPPPIDPSMLKLTPWFPSPLLWLAPFTGATVAYMLCTAIVLGVRRPLRVVAVVLPALFFLIAALELAAPPHLSLIPARVFSAVTRGPLGIDAVLTARTESLHGSATLTNGETMVFWWGLPELRDWALATLLWLSVASLSLFAAISRHRERRTP